MQTSFGGPTVGSTTLEIDSGDAASTFGTSNVDGHGSSIADLDARWGAWAIRVVVGLIIACHLALAMLPERILLRLTLDDTFYYVRVAQNVMQGHGSSFDGIQPTNGYHPLWMILMSPFTTLISDGTAQVRVLVLLQGVIAVAAVLLFVKLFRGRIGALPTALGLVLWRFNRASTRLRYRAETSLVCLVVLATVGAAFRYLDEQTRPEQHCLDSVRGSRSSPGATPSSRRRPSGCGF